MTKIAWIGALAIALVLAPSWQAQESWREKKKPHAPSNQVAALFFIVFTVMTSPAHFLTVSW